MEEKVLSFDYQGETKKVTKHWQFCVGSGHAFLAHRADYLEQLKVVHDELGIERVRFHGIFDDDMNVCQRPTDHLPVVKRNPPVLYNFYQIGSIYDRLLEIGVKPFVELGFMPSALASGRQTVFHYKGNVTQPKNMEKWKDFIRAFARFLINRYGAEEVRSWFFEVWNEPNLDCFFKGTMKDYFRLYKATAEALKEVDPEIKVGGPATTKGQHLTEFLDYCEKNNAPVDFITTHQYPTDELGHNLNAERLKQIKKIKNVESDDSLSRLLQPIFDNCGEFMPELKGYMTREAEAAKSKIGSLPLYYTEWSISSNCVAAVHDTPVASAFLVKTVLDNQGIVDGSSYWTFSDIFEELFFFPQPFTGGFGLMNIEGIKKPTFWAMKLLNKLPDNRYCIPVTDDEVEFTPFKDENGDLYIMAYAQNFAKYGREFKASLTIENAPVFSKGEIERINDVSGNPIALWEKMGKPSVLTREQTAEIKEKSEMKKEEICFEENDGRVSLFFTIKDHETLLIKLSK